MTLLNRADKLCLVSTAVDRVYLGSTLVWEPPFTPAELFTQVDAGTYFDPSVYTTVFSDSKFNVLALPGGYVASMFDMSKGMELGAAFTIGVYSLRRGAVLNPDGTITLGESQVNRGASVRSNFNEDAANGAVFQAAFSILDNPSGSVVTSDISDITGHSFTDVGDYQYRGWEKSNSRSSPFLDIERENGPAPVVIGNISLHEVLGSHAGQSDLSKAPLLLADGRFKYLLSDLVDDSLPATIPDLGTNATVWYSTEAGSVILTRQTLTAGDFETLRGEKTYAVGVIDRYLTTEESIELSKYLDRKRGVYLPDLNYDLSLLFKDGQSGTWLNYTDVNTQFQDYAGTQPVTALGQTVAHVRDGSGNDTHGLQSDVSKQPISQGDPDRLMFDTVDDSLNIQVPAGGWTGSMVMGSSRGTLTFGVSILEGAFNTNTQYSGDAKYPGADQFGILIRDGALSVDESNAVEQYLISKGALASFGGRTDLSNEWYGLDYITEFPMIDTSACEDFTSSWRDCRSMVIFPLIDTSSVYEFRSAWYQCRGLTSFPKIDTSSGEGFLRAWGWCRSLVDFPAGMFDNIKGGDFDNAFVDTNLSESSIDGILVSLVASGISSGTREFDQSGGSAPSSTGEAAITTLRSRGWTVSVTGGF